VANSARNHDAYNQLLLALAPMCAPPTQSVLDKGTALPQVLVQHQWDSPCVKPPPTFGGAPDSPETVSTSEGIVCGSPVGVSPVGSRPPTALDISQPDARLTLSCTGSPLVPVPAARGVSVLPPIGGAIASPISLLPCEWLFDQQGPPEMPPALAGVPAITIADMTTGMQPLSSTYSNAWLNDFSPQPSLSSLNNVLRQRDNILVELGAAGLSTYPSPVTTMKPMVFPVATLGEPVLDSPMTAAEFALAEPGRIADLQGLSLITNIDTVLASVPPAAPAPSTDLLALCEAVTQLQVPPASLATRTALPPSHDTHVGASCSDQGVFLSSLCSRIQRLEQQLATAFTMEQKMLAMLAPAE